MHGINRATRNMVHRTPRFFTFPVNFPVSREFGGAQKSENVRSAAAWKPQGLVPRGGVDHVPTRSGALSLRSAATTESAVMRPVRGFSEGMFSMASENFAEFASTSMA